MYKKFSCIGSFLNFVFLLFVCFFAPLCVEAAQKEPVALYLTWQRNPESTMMICWITPVDDDLDRVNYHPPNRQEWMQSTGFHRKLPGARPFFLHMIELTNLQADTDYAFSIGDLPAIYQFHTMPATLTGPIHFVVGGDVYHDGIDIVDKTNQQAAKTSPLFAVMGGDIAYASGRNPFSSMWTISWLDYWRTQKIDRWLEWLISWKKGMVTPEGKLIPLLAAIGNHDVSGGFDQTPAQAPFFYSLFPMPGKQGYQVLDFSNYLSLFLLDSGHTHAVGGQQAWWLAGVLKDRQHIPNKFAAYHVPAYPSVRKMEDATSTEIRRCWVPSFEKHHLTAAFEHHDHAYKRTHPLLGGVINPAGVIYLGDGAWGVEKPRVAKSTENDWLFAKKMPVRHFIKVTIEPSRRYVQAISSEGVLIDEYQFDFVH